jgi:hypothetical protein
VIGVLFKNFVFRLRLQRRVMIMELFRDVPVDMLIFASSPGRLVLSIRV